MHSFLLKVEEAVVYALAHHRRSSSLKSDFAGIIISILSLK